MGKPLAPGQIWARGAEGNINEFETCIALVSLVCDRHCVLRITLCEVINLLLLLSCYCCLVTAAAAAASVYLQDAQLATFMTTAHRQIRSLEDNVKELQKMP